MRITDEALDEFIELCKTEFGEEIDRTEAAELAHRVLAVYRLLRRSPPVQPTGADATPQASSRYLPFGRQT